MFILTDLLGRLPFRTVKQYLAHQCGWPIISRVGFYPSKDNTWVLYCTNECGKRIRQRRFTVANGNFSCRSAAQAISRQLTREK